MVDIKAVIQAIVRGCRLKSRPTSEMLAAFIVRSIIQENPSKYCLDSSVTDDEINRLVDASVQRLTEDDSPSLETIKMQVAFDATYVQNEEEFEEWVETMNGKVDDVHKQIVAIRPKHAEDFEVLTETYKLIFDAVMLRTADDSIGEKAVEREVMAAMESVFPRIGLRSFFQLSGEQKRQQTEELARLVLGIRLYNREIGKGGAGIDDSLSLGPQEASTLIYELEQEVAAVSEVTTLYSDVYLFIHTTKAQLATKEEESRWKQELNNRRQYLSLCQSLLEDVRAVSDKISAATKGFMSDLADLKSMVGGRSAVSKEAVYPKFDKLAMTFKLVKEGRKRLKARANTWASLRNFQQSYKATLLASPILQVMRKSGPAQAETSESNKVLEMRVTAPVNQEPSFSIEIPSASSREQQASSPKTPLSSSSSSSTTTSRTSSSHLQPNRQSQGVEGDDQPVVLNPENTPNFLQIPIDFQGYCPWTMIHRDGLLLPGNLSLGVVRYRNKFAVFADAAAMKAFMQQPQYYIDNILRLGQSRPELIHLLRLQEHFPEVSLSRILRENGYGTRKGGTVDQLLSDTLVQKRDASTETPTHFIKKHIDVNYHWNEWELRRRALRVVNLRKAQTHSTQTNASHFRRDNISQTFPTKDGETQTGISRGTNPVKAVTYVAGLRGVKGQKEGKSGASSSPSSKASLSHVGTVVLEYERK